MVRLGRLADVHVLVPLLFVVRLALKLIIIVQVLRPDVWIVILELVRAKLELLTANMAVGVVLQIDRDPLRSIVFWFPPDARSIWLNPRALHLLLAEHEGGGLIAHIAVVDRFPRVIQAREMGRRGLDITLPGQPTLLAPFEALLHPPLQKHFAVFQSLALIDGNQIVLIFDVTSQVVVTERAATPRIVLGRPGLLPVRADEPGEIHVRLRSRRPQSGRLRNMQC